MTIIIRDLTLEQRTLLREIAEYKHSCGIEVFETEVYDDLGQFGVELVGAASIVLHRLDNKGPLEFSVDFYDAWLEGWFDNEIDAAEYENNEDRKAKVLELKALFKK